MTNISCNMSRFLSPSKICLVILIELYRANEAQPSDSVTILSFISHHILTRSSDLQLDESKSRPSSIASVKDLEKLLSPLTSAFPGRSLFDLFLRHLWSLTSLEHLEELFQRVSQHYELVFPIADFGLHRAQIQVKSSREAKPQSANLVLSDSMFVVAIWNT